MKKYQDDSLSDTYPIISPILSVNDDVWSFAMDSIDDDDFEVTQIKLYDFDTHKKHNNISDLMQS